MTHHHGTTAGVCCCLRWNAQTITVIASLFALSPVHADDEPDASTPRIESLIRIKTLGGRQLWGDLRYFRGYRIQENVVFGQYRLIDPKDVRVIGGTLQECEQRLEAIRETEQLDPMSGPAVMLIHGIIRSSKSFSRMTERFEASGYTVIGFDYPSTRVGIQDSAQYLDSVIRSLDGIEQINIVVHSMGGLLVRAWLRKHNDPRIRRMVMLGVPNNGAQMADMFRRNPLFKTIFGPAGQQLITDPEGLINGLPTPKFDFGILAGSRGNIRGHNPLIPGDDDGTVSVANTRLPGAADFITVRAMHSFIMYNEEVIDLTHRFITEGHFRDDGKKHPIPGPAEKPDPTDTE